jgi:hypothetical protein
MLSDLAVVRPAAPRLESTATQHDDNPGGDGEKQDIFQTNATHWHGQPSPCGPMRFVDYDEDDRKEKGLVAASATCPFSLTVAARTPIGGSYIEFM